MQEPKTQSGLEQELSYLQTYISKIDASVEKLTAISADVTQLLAVHENRLTFQERMREQLETRVERNKELSDERYGKILDKMEEIKTAQTSDLGDARVEVLNKIQETNNKVSTLEKWMWTCLGGGAVAFLIIDKLVPNIHL